MIRKWISAAMAVLMTISAVQATAQSSNEGIIAVGRANQAITIATTAKATVDANAAAVAASAAAATTAANNATTAATNATTAASAAATSASAATASMNSLYKLLVTQIIGRPVDPITGSAAGANTYVWIDPVGTSGQLTQVEIFALTSGTVTIGRYTLVGSALTRMATTSTVAVAAGLNVLPITSFPVNAGDVLAIAPSASGVLAYTGSAADGAGWAITTAGLPATGTLGSTVTTQRIQVGFSISTQVQTVTAAAFDTVSSAATAASTAATAASTNATAALTKATSHDTAIAALSESVPSQTIGRSTSTTLTAGSSSAGANVYVPAVAVTSAGALDYVDLYVRPAATVPAPVTLYKFTLSGGVLTPVAGSSRTATISTAGAAVHLVGGTDYTALTVAAGEYIGIQVPAGMLAYANGSATDNNWYFTSTAGGSVTAQTNFIFQLRLGLSAPVQRVTAVAFDAKSDRPIAGKNVGIIGDSIASIFGQVWQTAFLARTGATLYRQDARPGRTWASALEGYGASAPLASLSSLTGYVGGTVLSGSRSQSPAVLSTYNIYGQVPADGTTLSQWLAPLDILIIALGTNDSKNLADSSYSGVGTITDAYTAGTLDGAMNFVLDAIQTAKPNLRIIGVTNGYTTGWGGNANDVAVANAEVAMFEARGLPILNGLKTFGIGPLTASTLLRDGIHPTNPVFSNIYGPTVGGFAERNGVSP